MGCINSRADINDLHPNIFQVINVDDLGNLVAPGRLEVTDGDIILYQRSKQPIKWPLRCLRRYGYDAEIFSFESGRRCSTGPGIYAFKCRRAAHLSNLVQTSIQQVYNNSGDDTVSRELSVSVQSGPSITRVAIPLEPTYLDPTPIRNHNRTGPRLVHNQQNGVGRLGSIGSSGGPMSPQGTMGSPSPPSTLPPLPPPPPIPQSQSTSLYANEEVLLSIPLEMEHNNNKTLRRAMQRIYTVNSNIPNNGLVGAEVALILKKQDVICNDKISSFPVASYMNIDISNDVSPLSPNHSIPETTPFKEEINGASGSEHAYMNISPGHEYTDPTVKIRPLPLSSLHPDLEDGTRHCYANLEANEIESLKKRFSGVSISEKSFLLPSTPTGTIREVNYAILDLDRKNGSANSPMDGGTNLIPSPPESPNKPQKGYATIDFNKTAALSHSANPNLVNDYEGSRKTRHNSTINDLAAPSRLSFSINIQKKATGQKHLTSGGKSNGIGQGQLKVILENFTNSAFLNGVAYFFIFHRKRNNNMRPTKCDSLTFR